MTYDQKCWELAVAFVNEIDRPLKTRKELSHELAQQIQKAIEDFLEDVQTSEKKVEDRGK